MITHLTDHARLMSLSTALIRGIEEPQEYDGTPFQISASLGVLVHLGGTPWEAADVLHRVDEAVYASKHGGAGTGEFRGLMGRLNMFKSPFVVPLFATVPNHLILARFIVVPTLFFAFTHGGTDQNTTFLALFDVAG